MFLLPIFDFHANGEQDHKKCTTCLYLAVLCSLWMWDNWLCSFSIEVLRKQHHCNPQLRLSVELQILLILSTYRTSTLNSSFFYYMTRWRQLHREKVLSLPAHLWCRQVSIEPAGYCFREHKSNGVFHLQCFWKKITCEIHFGCTT